MTQSIDSEIIDIRKVIIIKVDNQKTGKSKKLIKLKFFANN
jgi:hypothetical protein